MSAPIVLWLLVGIFIALGILCFILSFFFKPEILYRYKAFDALGFEPNDWGVLAELPVEEFIRRVSARFHARNNFFKCRVLRLLREQLTPETARVLHLDRAERLLGEPTYCVIESTRWLRSERKLLKIRAARAEKSADDDSETAEFLLKIPPELERDCERLNDALDAIVNLFIKQRKKNPHITPEGDAHGP